MIPHSRLRTPSWTPYRVLSAVHYVCFCAWAYTDLIDRFGETSELDSMPRYVVVNPCVHILPNWRRGYRTALVSGLDPPSRIQNLIRPPYVGPTTCHCTYPVSLISIKSYPRGHSTWSPSVLNGQYPSSASSIYIHRSVLIFHSFFVTRIWMCKDRTFITSSPHIWSTVRHSDEEEYLVHRASGSHCSNES